MSKAQFVGDLKVLNDPELKALGISRASLISEASSLIPENVDMEKGVDILPVVFNLAVVNSFNANGDGIDSISAAKMVKNFIHRPINLEHHKTDIVGHIINASFSDKQPDFFERDITDFIDRKEPFYITAAAVIYKHVFPELSDVISQSSDKESPYYQAFSTSWEVGFNDFDVVVGEGDSREVYEKGSEGFDSYKDNLKVFGGSGFYNDKPVNRLLKGSLYPLGAAITENPAAKVKGIYTKVVEKIANANKKSSQNKKEDVTNNKDSDNFQMTEEQFNQLTELLKGISEAKNFDSESKASEAFTEIQKTLKEVGEGWQSKAQKAEAEAKEIEAEAKKIEEDLAASKVVVENLEKEIAEANESIKSLKEDAAVRDAAEKFNSRMASLANEFDFTDSEEEIVSDEVRALNEDEDFDKYVEKAKVVFAHRIKVEEEAPAEEEEIETSETSEASVTNNNGDESEQKSLFERVREAGLTVAS